MSTFVFALWPTQHVEGKPGYYRVATITTHGVDVEDAYAKAEPQIPQGSRVWSWYEEYPTKEIPLDNLESIPYIGLTSALRGRTKRKETAPLDNPKRSGITNP